MFLSLPIRFLGQVWYLIVSISNPWLVLTLLIVQSCIFILCIAIYLTLSHDLVSGSKICFPLKMDLKIILMSYDK